VIRYLASLPIALAYAKDSRHKSKTLKQGHKMRFPRQSKKSLFSEPMLLIYKITHCKSGKAYIGMTSRGIVRRLKEHRCASERGDESPFYRALRKYGEKAFHVTILAICANEDDLLPIEISLIKKHRTYVHDGGYNIPVETFSKPGWKHSDETRAKMRIAAAKRMANPEARARISKTLTGISRPPWTDERKQARINLIAKKRAI
jgi:group I intron endonuclease